MATNRRNEHIYSLVRVNLLATVKGSYFVDRPNYVVRKVDQLFNHMHSSDHLEFLQELKTRLKEMKKDFDYEITEYTNLTAMLDGMIVFIDQKLKEEAL